MESYGSFSSDDFDPGTIKAGNESLGVAIIGGKCKEPTLCRNAGGVWAEHNLSYGLSIVVSHKETSKAKNIRERDEG